MNYFNCIPIENFPLKIGTNIISKVDYGKVKKGMKGKIIELIATQTYGIDFEEIGYFTLWDCDVMPDLKPHEAFYYGQDCYKAYIKREVQISIIKRFGLFLLGIKL